MIKKLKKISGSKRGETIAETIIALSILAIGITLSSTLMSTSLKNINISKNRVVAVNIAREGIEAVRNIRDTNWLKFSGRRRTCWNHMPGSDPEETCDDSSPLIAPGSYIVYKNDGDRWRLAGTTATVEGIAKDATPIFTVDIDENTDTDKDGNLTNDADMYNHIYTGTGEDDDALGKDYAKPTIFSRKITIDYLDNDGKSIGTGSLDDTYNRMLVTSTVSWEEQGGTKTVELKTHLTDYLGRDNLDS
jgi:hypothetical protein